MNENKCWNLLKTEMRYPEKDCSVPNLVHGDKIASTTIQKLDAFSEQIKKVFSESVPHIKRKFRKGNKKLYERKQSPFQT